VGTDITTHPTSPLHIPELPEIVPLPNYLHADHPLFLFKNNVHFLNSNIPVIHKILLFNGANSCANFTTIHTATGQIRYLLPNFCLVHSTTKSKPEEHLLQLAVSFTSQIHNIQNQLKKISHEKNNHHPKTY